LKGSPVRERDRPDVGDSVAVVEEVGENGVEQCSEQSAPKGAQERRISGAGLIGVAYQALQLVVDEICGRLAQDRGERTGYAGGAGLRQRLTSEHHSPLRSGEPDEFMTASSA
jgi:hypothetical protein